MANTRQKILNKLGQSPPISAGELARALSMTQPNIRYHLNKLMAEGQVVIVGELKPLKRGRPTLLYSSTLQATRQRLDPLVRSLWDEMLDGQSFGAQARRKQKLARRIIDRRVETSHKVQLPQRLGETVERLNSIGYQARWEAHSEAPHIVLERCPFDSIFSKLPELCELDICVIEDVLGIPVEQIHHRSQIAGRGSACVFRLNQES